MKKLNIFALLVITLCFCSSASGQETPDIVQTGCDISGAEQVRIQFSFTNTTVGLMCNFIVFPWDEGSPEPSDTCQIDDCGAPQGWGCSSLPSSAGRAFRAVSDSEFIVPGQTLDGFSLITESSETGCCFQFAFFACAILESYATETICFDCSRPVQSLGSSWGRLKVSYR